MDYFLDLKPRKSSFVYKDRKFKFRAFDVATHIWVLREFATVEQPNGMAIFAQKIAQNDVVAIGKISFYLLKNKGDFKDYRDLLEFFANVYDVYKLLLTAINETIGNSQPEATEDSEDIANLKKLKAADLMRPLIG